MKAQIAIALLLYPLCGWSDVNMRDGSFAHEVKALSHPIFSKVYHSKSLYSGSFGFGWCAEFEKTVSIANQHRQGCSQNSKIQLKKRKDNWSSTQPDGTIETYYRHGKLQSYQKPGFAKASLFYNSKGKLDFILIENQKYAFKYFGQGSKIREISSPSNRILYRYSNQNLAEIRNSEKKSLKFEYDSYHNLILIQHSSGKQTQISYVSALDEVKEIRFPSGCVEKFHYEKTSATELKSTIERSCPSFPAQKKVFKFLSQKTPQGLFLKQIQTAGDSHGTWSLP